MGTQADQLNFSGLTLSFAPYTRFTVTRPQEIVTQLSFFMGFSLARSAPPQPH